MEQPPTPPQSEIPNHLVEVRPNDSPRTRRYRSNEPVVTPAQLYDNVTDNEKSNGSSARASPASGRAARDAALPPVGDVDPAPVERPRPPPPPRRRFLVRRACCCLSLQQGAYFIGVLQVVNSVLLLLLELMYLGGILFVGAYALDDDLTGTLPENQLTWRPTDIAYASLSGVILFMELMVLLFACLLLHGARKKRPGFVRAWMFYMAGMLAAGLGMWAGKLTLEFMYRTSHGVALIFRALIELTPPFYFLIVVRSYYYQMVDEIAGITPVDAEGVPLMRQPPPPYSQGDGGTEEAPPLPQKRLLETNFDHMPPPTPTPDTRFDIEDDEAGFGPGWAAAGGPVRENAGQQLRQQRPALMPRTGSGNESGTNLPRVVATMSRDGEVLPVRNSGPLPHEDERTSRDEASRYEDEDSDVVEIRPLSRRVIGAGPRVLPPLPPGHRESLQHVVMDLPLPPPPRDPSLV